MLGKVTKENDGEERSVQNAVSTRQDLWVSAMVHAIELIHSHSRASRNGPVLQGSQKYTLR